MTTVASKIPSSVGSHVTKSTGQLVTLPDALSCCTEQKAVSLTRVQSCEVVLRLYAPLLLLSLYRH
jgi:hypothetical protein